MGTKFLIGGNYLTPLLAPTSIDAKLGRQMDIAHVEIIDLLGTIDIDERDEIIISDDAETFRYFGGYVAKITLDTEAGGRGGIYKVYKLDCQDYTSITDSRRVKKVYESQTEKFIIQDVFGDYTTGFDSDTYVDTGDTLTYVTFDQASIRQILDELCAASGREWNIDYWKNVWYFDTATAASFGLSNSSSPPDTYPFQVLEYTKDASQIRNSVTVQGVEKIYAAASFWYGNGNANNPTGNIGCNDSKLVFTLPYKFLPGDDATSYFLLAYNTGADAVQPGGTWHNTIPGIEGTDKLIADGGIYSAVWNADLCRLTWDVSVPPVDLGYSIYIWGRYSVPIDVVRTDPTSIGLYGTWEDYIEDNNIASESMANMVGDAYLAENAYPKVSLKVRCWQDGLEVGQKIPITETLLGITGNFIIQEIGTKFIKDDLREYTISVDAYKVDTIDILLKLQDSLRGATAGKIGGVTTGRSVDITVDLNTDHSFSGIYTSSIAGEALTFGNIVQYDATSETWHKTDGDAEATTEGWIGVCLTDADEDDEIQVLLYGTVRDDTWDWTSAHGHDPLYISGTAGAMTRESGATNFVRRVGIAITPDIIWFTGDLALVERV